MGTNDRNYYSRLELGTPGGIGHSCSERTKQVVDIKYATISSVTTKTTQPLLERRTHPPTLTYKTTRALRRSPPTLFPKPSCPRSGVRMRSATDSRQPCATVLLRTTSIAQAASTTLHLTEDTHPLILLCFTAIQGDRHHVRCAV